MPPLMGALAIVTGLPRHAGDRRLDHPPVDLRPEPRDRHGPRLAIDYSLFVVSRYREELARAGRGARRWPGRWPPPGGPSCSAP
jgi:hypothetical protein